MKRSISCGADESSGSDVGIGSHADHPGYGTTEPKRRGKHTYNEDSRIAFDTRYDRWQLLADGHGGSFSFSDFVVKRVTEIVLCATTTDLSNMSDFFVRICYIVHTESLNPELRLRGGTTFIMSCTNKITGKTYVANLGDSKCLIVRNGAIVFESKDLSANNPSEQERMRSMRYARIRRDTRDGAIRLYADYLATSGTMTTAGFGDFSQIRRGEDPMLRIPVISEIDLKVGDVILLASDGLFETLVGKMFKAEKDTTISARDIADGLEQGVQNLAKFFLDRHEQYLAQQYRECVDPDRQNYTDEQCLKAIRDVTDNKAVLVYVFALPVSVMCRNVSTSY